MPKWTTLTNTQSKDVLDKERLNTQGTKAEMAARITKHFGSDEVTAAALCDVPTPPVTERESLMVEIVSRLSTQTNRSPERRSTEINDVPETVPGATHDANTRDAGVYHQQTTIQPNHYSVKEIAETIPTFDPNDEGSLTAEKYIDRIRNVMIAHQFDERCLLLATYSRLSGVARLWLDAHPALFVNLSDFADALISEFAVDLDEDTVHTFFDNYVKTTPARFEDAPDPGGGSESLRGRNWRQERPNCKRYGNPAMHGEDSDTLNERKTTQP